MRRWPAPGAIDDDRFSLRQIRPSDRDAYLASIDDEVRRRQGWGDDEVARDMAWFDAWARKRVLEPYQRIVVDADGRFAGSYILEPSPVKEADVDVGWWLAPHARGQGLGQASLAAVLDHVHQGIGARVARMGTNHDNARAIRQIEAVGAVLFGEFDHVLPNRQVVRSYWYHHTAD